MSDKKPFLVSDKKPFLSRAAVLLSFEWQCVVARGVFTEALEQEFGSHLWSSILEYMDRAESFDPCIPESMLSNSNLINYRTYIKCLFYTHICIERER